jgi:hypothetical protein
VVANTGVGVSHWESGPSDVVDSYQTQQTLVARKVLVVLTHARSYSTKQQRQKNTSGNFTLTARRKIQEAVRSWIRRYNGTTREPEVNIDDDGIGDIDVSTVLSYRDSSIERMTASVD